MPDYTVTVAHTVRIVGTLTVKARSEEAAVEKAEALAAQGALGTVSWTITDCTAAMDDWFEEEVNLKIEEATED